MHRAIHRTTLVPSNYTKEAIFNFTFQTKSLFWLHTHIHWQLNLLCCLHFELYVWKIVWKLRFTLSQKLLFNYFCVMLCIWWHCHKHYQSNSNTTSMKFQINHWKWKCFGYPFENGHLELMHLLLNQLVCYSQPYSGRPYEMFVWISGKNEMNGKKTRIS